MLQQEVQIETAVRNELVRYLAGEITLNEFRNWFDAETWSVSSELAADIDRLIAEYSNGDWTEEGLRRRFVSLAEWFFAAQSWGDSGLKMTTGTSSPGVIGEPSESTVDIQLAVAS